MAIESEFTGSLPYLTTFITAVWTAYGASISFYQSKSGKENIEKIKNNYESCSSYGSVYNEDIDI